jgi:hypothetical protein
MAPSGNPRLRSKERSLRKNTRPRKQRFLT